MPDQLPPEIETLPQFVIVLQDRDGWTPERGPEGQPMCMGGVLLEDAEAALLACEQRMLADVARACRMRDTERERTVREIVQALRDLAHNEFGDGHPAILEAADMIEQRFGGEKEEA